MIENMHAAIANEICLELIHKMVKLPAADSQRNHILQWIDLLCEFRLNYYTEVKK